MKRRPSRSTAAAANFPTRETKVLTGPRMPMDRVVAAARLARALITNPKILIFDEATSALDYESERIIRDNMVAISKGRTVLIIAHRLSAVRSCHRILTIEKGRLVEDGSHEQLMRGQGRYAQLYNHQIADAGAAAPSPGLGGLHAAQ